MKSIIRITLLIALAEFVIAIIFPPLVAYPFFMIFMLLGGDFGDSAHPPSPYGAIPAVLTIACMTIVPALLIKWLRTDREHVR